jgi:hypothetical protein
MAENEPSGVVQCLWDAADVTYALDGDDYISRSISERQRHRWYSAVPAVIALGAMGVAAVGIVVSGVAMVSRQPVGDTGAVVPTVPLTTTTPAATPPPSDTQSPTTTQAPSYVPPSTSAIITTTVEPSATQPPPNPLQTSTRPPTSSAPPASAHPTPHPPFPRQTTDFGP